MRSLGPTTTVSSGIVTKSYVDATMFDGYQPPVSGGLLQPSNVVSTGAAAINANNLLDLSPFNVVRSQVFTGIAINVTTALVAGSATVTMTLLLYKDDGTGGRPDIPNGLLASGSTGALTSTGQKTYTFPSAITLAPGRYWGGSHYTQSTSPTTAAQFTSISGALQMWIPSGGTVGAAARTLRFSTATVPTTNPTWTFGSTAVCVNLVAQ